jgi:hypothetical protein
MLLPRSLWKDRGAARGERRLYVSVSVTVTVVLDTVAKSFHVGR